MNTSRPRRNQRFRPDRSAIRPEPSSSAPNTTLYDVRIHDSAAVETSGNDASIDGNATFTIDRSRATMNAPVTVIANTVHGILAADGSASRQARWVVSCNAS